MVVELKEKCFKCVFSLQKPEINILTAGFYVENKKLWCYLMSMRCLEHGYSMHQEDYTVNFVRY